MSLEKKSKIEIDIPEKYIPRRTDGGVGLGDLVKLAFDTIGLDCAKKKWLPKGCRERREALNRFRIGRK